MTFNTKHLAGLLGVLFTLFIAFTLSAQEKTAYVWPVQLNKTYSKTYPLGAEKVAVLNRFGSMKIETWDRNEVKVDANLSVSGQTNEYVTRLLDALSVSEEKTNDRIGFTTKIGPWQSEGSHEIRIDFIVHVPASAKLYAENSYGPLTVGNYNGELELVCRYGILTAGQLSNALSVGVQYGTAKIASVSDSRLLFRYSKVEIEKLSGTISGQFDYCSSIDLPIDNGLKELELKNNYTGLYLMLPKDISASYDITTTNARLTSKTAFAMPEDVSAYAKSTAFHPSHKYTGTLGKGAGTQINIKSNNGNIRVL